MSEQLRVRNKTFNYPSPGDSPGWGEDATGWAKEVTSTLALLINSNDILLSTVAIANNVTSASNINKLQFSNTRVRTAIINYQIYRVTSTTELVENGNLTIAYKSNTNTWDVQRDFANDNSGIVFSVLSSGQVQYTSSNLSGLNYSGSITFSAKTFQQ